MKTSLLLLACALCPALAFGQSHEAYLKAFNAEAGDSFGQSVAASWRTMVVGAMAEASAARGVNGNDADNSAADAGAVYVYSDSGSQWLRQAYLKGSNTEANDSFGYCLAMSGETLVVGAPGEASNATGVNGNQADNSLTDAGAVYVFVRTGSQWVQQAYLKASNSNAGDDFGWSVAISGNTLVVGAPGEASNATGINGNQTDNSLSGAGAAYVFVRSGTTWTQQAYLKASNPGADDSFGYSVGIADNSIVVGAYQEDSDSVVVNGDQTDNTAPNAGAGYVFTRSGSKWTQQAYLKTTDSTAGDALGIAAAISGDTVLLGAPGETSLIPGNTSDTSGTSVGAAYAFVRSGTTWTQQVYLKAAQPDSNDNFGRVLALQGDRAVIGAPGEAGNGTLPNGNDQSNDSAPGAGAAYHFIRQGSAWTQQAYMKASNGESGDSLGTSVAITDDFVLLGAKGEASNATGVNGNSADNSAAVAGAAYVIQTGPFFTSLGKTGVNLYGVPDVAVASFGQPCMAESGGYFTDVGLTGAGATSGRNRGLLSQVDGSDALAMQTGDAVGGLAGLPYGAKITAFRAPVYNSSTYGAGFLATVSGTGVTSKNNTLLMNDNGIYVSAILRTGTAQAALGGASLSTIPEFVQHRSDNLLGICYTLTADSSLGVSSSNDTGILQISHSGAVTSVHAREAQPVFGGGPELFGHFTGRATSVSGAETHFINKVTFTGNTPKDSHFFMNGDATFQGRSNYSQGDPGAGMSGTERYGTFLALTQMSSQSFLKAAITGSPTSKNEGIWQQSTLLLRKGDTQVATGLTVAKIIRFWGINGAQLLAHVQLAGTGVTSSNNQALILRNITGDFQILLRTGSPAPGIGSNAIKVGAISAIAVDSVSGNYAAVGTLSGASSTTNQALWTGCTLDGNNTTLIHQRLPVLTLRKGGLYNSTYTSLGTIKSLLIKPVVDATGAGNRGLAEVINSFGAVQVIITTDRNVQELLVVRP